MFNIPKDTDYDDFDDADLEAELELILSGKQPTSTRSSNAANQSRPKNQLNNVQPKNQSNNAQPKIQQQSHHDINMMNNLAQMNNLNLNDDDDDFDENDPELNAQLAEFLGEDLPSYSPSKKVISNTSGVSSSNLSSNQSQMTKPIRPAPPINKPMVLNQTSTQQTTVQPQQLIKFDQQPNNNCIMLDNSHFIGTKTVQTTNQTKEQLLKMKDEYKRLALDAKKNNDIENAKLYLTKMKDTENAIETLNNGQQINPTSFKPPSITNQTIQSEQNKQSNTPQQANTLLEELEQRRQKLESSMQKEANTNNTSIVKMMGRVIKQYDNAIKACKSGRQYDYKSLPPPVGCSELSLESFSNENTNKLPVSQPNQTVNQSNQTVNIPINKIPNIQQQTVQNEGKISKASKLQQLEKLKEDFKMKALDAKRNNDLKNAKYYLEKMKEVNLMIEDLDKESVNEKLQKSSQSKNEQPQQNILEALEQRKAKLESILQKEQSENNTSKIRSVTRILKQYEAAIKANKLGKQYDYEILPVPPGFDELKIDQIQPPSISSNKSAKEQEIKSPKSEPNSANPQTTTDKTTRPPLNRGKSVNNKQLDYLLQRQKLFKEAAVESNTKGDTSQALDYLRKAKGFEPLIMAVENGLPIDVSNIPIPPQLEADDFVMISKSTSNNNFGIMDLDKEEHYRKLELELEKQINLCTKNKEHFYKIGDVSTGSKFEKYLIDMKKDYEMLKSYKLRNEDVPKYHYENKEFSIVVCNTDVPINECIIEIIRGIDLPCKTPVDSYVKFDFPFPKDAIQPAKTHSFKNSLYPEYNQSFKFAIDRKARSLARIFNKSIKFEIYSKGGFFKSDELVGHINVELKPLHSKCTIFDSFPILNGRREIGGKLQIKIKIREPLLAKQVEEIKEKWLVFD